MRLAMGIVMLVLVCSLLTGCAGIVTAPVVPPPGWVYSDFKAPLDFDQDNSALGSKVGRATIKNILGIVSTGDASIMAAAKDGQITKIVGADYEMKNVLGLFSEFTVIVYGD